MLPSREECFEIFKQYHTPANIIRHSLAVSKAANYLADKFYQAGLEIDKDLVDRAALLHDVLRVCDIKNDLYTFMDSTDKTPANKKIWQEQRKKYKNQHHAEATAELFQDKYPRMAAVIRKHRLSAIINNSLRTWEEKIVYYADKRVDHQKFVSLDKRISEGKKRWQVKKNQDQSSEILNKMKELEKEIFDKIKEKPHAINLL